MIMILAEAYILFNTMFPNPESFKSTPSIPLQPPTMSPSSSPTYTLYHAPSMSSTYIIALFEILSVPNTVIKTIDVDFDRINGVFGSKEAEGLYEELRGVNPLGQFPTLVVRDADGDGEEFVLTEMAAIAFCQPTRVYSSFHVLTCNRPTR